MHEQNDSSIILRVNVKDRDFWYECARRRGLRLQAQIRVLLVSEFGTYTHPKNDFIAIKSELEQEDK